MLEHVGPQQSRFVTPGLSPDPRGVVLGRYLGLLLPAIDRVVGLFRGLSEVMNLDELVPTLKILQVRTPLSSREFFVQLPVTGSYAADQIAAVGRFVGGLPFTGTTKHFVRYRDRRSPLGYDVDNLQASAGDIILYAGDFVQSYSKERQLEFSKLVQTLLLQRGGAATVGAREPAFARVERGLWPKVLSYLHRNNVQCAAAACHASASTGASPTDTATSLFYLIRGEEIPSRIVRLFGETPGVEVYRPVCDNVAVQVGYQHPIELSACPSVFPDEAVYLFSGVRQTLETIDPAPVFVSAARLVTLGDGRLLEAPVLRAIAPDAISVPLRLVPSAGDVPRVTASRIDRARASWLKKLAYLLPPQVLAAFRVCLTDDYIYLACDAEPDLVPLGELFYSPAPGVMVPVGLQLIPRVHPDVLMQHLEASGEQLFFFCRDQQVPICLMRSDFLPLSPASLAPVAVQRPHTTAPRPELPAGQLTNQPVGMFPLWGFSTELPQGDPAEDE